MNDESGGSGDLTRLVRDITSGEPEESVERVMDERLREFRERLPNHPYVRRLERRGGIRPIRIWFIAGRPVAVRWAAAALSVAIIVVAGLAIRRQEIVPVAWAEVADQMAAIDRMMISMHIQIGAAEGSAGERLQEVPAEAETGAAGMNEVPADVAIMQPDEGKQPPPAAARAVRSEAVRSDEVEQEVGAREAAPTRGRGGQVAQEAVPSPERREMAASEPAAERARVEEGQEGANADMDFYLSKEGGFRWDVLSGSHPVTSLFIPPAGDSMIRVLHEEKSWVELPVDRDHSSRSIPAVENDPAEYIRRFTAGGYRELGESVIGDVRVIGIEVDDPPAGDEGVIEGVGRLWIEPLSRLPVRLELIGEAAGEEVRWVFDFRWGEQVDPGAFDPQVPPGRVPPSAP
jgi:hypothetical protein